MYANRIIDNQTANRRCYEKNPNVNIVEGFGFSNIWSALVWIAVIVAIVFVALYFYDKKTGQSDNIFSKTFSNIKDKFSSKTIHGGDTVDGFTEILEMFK